jgi:hypothetical protein
LQNDDAYLAALTDERYDGESDETRFRWDLDGIRDSVDAEVARMIREHDEEWYGENKSEDGD